ncbi:hypothetical protein B0H17DRAFT_1045225 [Mycena rosella]|uniref:Uncharacterized protein n=1 Tax=Mycena rosella TaxID=1033263 RepID=A0AAD7DWD9_MYCRO|nr:hypothetical protein B0H17DRAFT_1045225 [Mycena rosella]
MMHVQELVDLTIDFLHDSLDDLRRCSLISRSWLPASQYHLFSNFALQSELEFHRFVAMLEELPHVLVLITHLALAIPRTTDELVYGGLVNIHFPNLRQLTIYTFPSEGGLPLLQRLVSIPSITHIWALQTRDPRWLFSIFYLRTANLRTLAISSRYFGPDPSWLSSQQEFPHPPPGEHFQIDCLCISSATKDLADLIHNPSTSPFDLTVLKRLVLWEEFTRTRPFGDNLQKIGSSLLELELNGPIAGRPDSFGRALKIGPETLPRLFHFTFHILSPSALAAVPGFLSTISSGDALQHVTLVLSRDCAPSSTDLSHFVHVQSWNTIDHAVQELGSVFLTLRVSLMACGALESQVGVDSLRGCLPRLATTRRLRVIAIS